MCRVPKGEPSSEKEETFSPANTSVPNREKFGDLENDLTIMPIQTRLMDSPRKMPLLCRHFQKSRSKCLLGIIING